MTSIPIDTHVMFAIPLGVTTIPTEICDVMKTLEGQEQGGNKARKPGMFNIIDKHPRIKNDITEIFSVWINNINNTPEQKWAMTTSWVTLNPRGDAMVLHRHYNCAYSGVLYFDTVDPEHPGLKFLNPIEELNGSFLIDVKNESQNVFNSNLMQGEIKEGQMIFFPSYIVHGHDPFKETDIVRKSFACNFMPIGKYGRWDSTLDTNWLTNG